MKIVRVSDYGDHITAAKMCMKNIEKNMLDHQFETAKMMAHELQLIAMQLEKSIQSQIK